MAKKNKYDRQHLRNLSVYELRIDRIYQDAIREAAAIGAKIGSVRGDGIFRFSDYPATRTRVERLMQTLKNRMQAVVVNGIDAEWTLSNNKNSELARQVFGKNVGRLSQSQYRRYFSTNEEARQAFQLLDTHHIGSSRLAPLSRVMPHHKCSALQVVGLTLPDTAARLAATCS